MRRAVQMEADDKNDVKPIDCQESAALCNISPSGVRSLRLSQCPPPFCRRIDTVSIVSLNVLFEGHYVRYVQGRRMPSDFRAALAVGFLEWTARGSTGGGCVDIFALQECDENLISAALRRMQGFQAVTAVSLSGGGETTAILFDSRGLDVVGNPSTLKFKDGHGSKTAVKQLFRHKATGKMFAVISAHVPFEASLEGQRNVLSELRDFVSLPECRKYILCGDFNIDMSRAEMVMSEAFPPHVWQDATKNVAASCLNPRGALTKIDYVFHTLNTAGGYALRPGRTAAWPSVLSSPTSGVPSQLIPHDKDTVLDVSSPFFSDHAALGVEFMLHDTESAS